MINLQSIPKFFDDLRYRSGEVASTNRAPTFGVDSLYHPINIDASALATHLSDLGNPHQVTKAQVGLSNVANVLQEPAIPTGLISQYIRGDKSLATLNAAAIPDFATKVAEYAPIPDLSAYLQKVDNLAALTDVSTARTNLGLGTAATMAAAAFAAVAHNHAASEVTSGTFDVARLGSGSAAAGKYVDGGAGVWTTLPSATITVPGSGTELMYRSSGTVLAALTGSSVSGSVLTTTSQILTPAAGTVGLSFNLAISPTANPINVTANGGAAGGLFKVSAAGLMTATSITSSPDSSVSSKLTLAGGNGVAEIITTGGQLYIKVGGVTHLFAQNNSIYGSGGNLDYVTLTASPNGVISGRSFTTTPAAGVIGHSINLAASATANAFNVTSSGGTAGDRFKVAANGDTTAFGIVRGISFNANGSAGVSGTIGSLTIVGGIVTANDNLLRITDTVGTPATPAGGGILFSNAGALKYVGSSGTVTPLATA